MGERNRSGDDLIRETRESDQFPWWEWSIPENRVTAGPRKLGMLGYDEAEFSGAGYEAYTDLVHPDDYERTMEAMRAYLEGRAELYQIDYRIRTKTGDYVWYMDRGVVVERGPDGEPLVLRGIVLNLGPEFHKLALDEAVVDSVRRALPSAESQRPAVICAQCGRLGHSLDRWIPVDESFPEVLVGDITHTLCPDCIRTLYPQAAQQILARLRVR